MNGSKFIKQNGFSLIEIAIGILILSLIVAGFNGVFKFIFDGNYKLAEQQSMEHIEKSLNTFLLVNSYIPCPDTDEDGFENRTTVTTASGNVEVCTSREGTLPFNDIGVEDKDAWGNPYYYRVHQRATSATYVNDICEPASVLGRSGPRSKADLWLCPDTNLYYCADISSTQNCNTVCSVTCTNTTDPRQSINTTLPPFFHLVTPPYGTVSGSYNLTITGEDGVQKGEGVVAVVVSWGANGDSVNRGSCSGGTANELENCDNDRNFIDTQTGKDRDFLSWVTVNQAKTAIILTGELR